MNKPRNFKYSFYCSVRNSIFILMVCILPVLSSAQTHLDRKVSANYSQLPLESVLNDLTSKTQVKFSYSSNRIPVDAQITASFSNAALYEILNELFQDLPVRYELMDDYIILKKEKPGKINREETEEKRFTLNGYVKDVETGEILIGATIFIPEIETGTITNKYGFFSLTLPLGTHELTISYIGYKAFTVTVKLGSNMKFDFKLEPSLNIVEEVVIAALSKEEIQFKKVASQSEVMPEQIKKLPALFGESDVLKNLEMQAGINYYGDGSSYFHVRGGHYDQNLILLDEATLYNPSHMLGLFSPIIPDAVKSVDIYKAGFPVRYGGRLSSVIDIRTRDGNLNKLSASGAIGIISGRISLEGPVKKGHSSWFISFRRSYFDTYFKRLSPTLNSLFFYDFTTKFNLKLGARDRLFITFYKGSDVLRLKEDNNKLIGLDWSNSSTTLRWNHILGSKTFMNFTVYGSKYDYYLHHDMSTGSYWNSRINNLSFKEEVSFFPSPKFMGSFGIQLGAYEFNPGNFTSASNREEIQVSPVRSVEGVIFAGAEHEISKWLAMQYGLRLSVWGNTGKAFVMRYNDGYELESIDYYLENQQYYGHGELEPRLSLSARLASGTFLKMSYSRTVQYINLISNSISPFNSFEVWLPAGPNIKPQKADIYDLGIIKNFDKQRLNLQTDIFWKQLYNQIGYTYHANMLMNPLIEGELRQGDGYAYGLEISLNQESDKLKTQLAYTFLRSFLHIEDLNGGEIYPAPQDRPHTINMSISYQINPRWLLTGNFNLASGARLTTPTSFYYYQGYQVPLYTEKNNDRLPPYSRLDIAASFRLNKVPDAFTHSLTFAVYNAYAQQNPIFLYYNKTVDDDGTLMVPNDRMNPQELTPSIRYTFVFMPSITYQFNF